MLRVDAQRTRMANSTLVFLFVDQDAAGAKLRLNDAGTNLETDTAQRLRCSKPIFDHSATRLIGWINGPR